MCKSTPFNTSPAQMARQREIFDEFLDSIVEFIASDGVWVAPDRAPLNAREVSEAFERIAGDSRYSRQHFATRTVDGQVVTLLNGIITTEPEPEEWP